ncbi:MAG: ATP-binding protein [Bacteroidales bacterium]|nr:ATP-binding protein [Bacteroidales bacterium]
MSIKDEIILNFDASSDKFAENSQVITVNENTRLLRFALIYGYNASGKSNILKAINFLRNFWIRITKSDSSGTLVTPFKLDETSKQNPSSFDLTFFVKGVKYRYLLELDSLQVRLERLLYYKTAKPIELFSRKLKKDKTEIIFKSSAAKVSKLAAEAINLACLKNMSFFAAKGSVNVSIPLIDEAKNWLQTHMAQGIDPTTNVMNAAKKGLSEDSTMPSYLVQFLKSADFNISFVKSDVENDPQIEKVFQNILNADGISEEQKNRLLDERLAAQTKLQFSHDVETELGFKTFPMSEEEESRGTLRTLELETALYYVLKGDYFMTVDEIESSLHPKLLETLLFNYLKENSESQILITTHNDGLLDLVDDLIRKDSIFFVEKQKNGSSDLYRLTDFKGLNRLSSIRAAYRNKRFGATQFSV